MQVIISEILICGTHLKDIRSWCYCIERCRLRASYFRCFVQKVADFAHSELGSTRFWRGFELGMIDIVAAVAVAGLGHLFRISAHVNFGAD